MYTIRLHANHVLKWPTAICARLYTCCALLLNSFHVAQQESGSVSLPNRNFPKRSPSAHGTLKYQHSFCLAWNTSVQMQMGHDAFLENRMLSESNSAGKGRYATVMEAICILTFDPRVALLFLAGPFRWRCTVSCADT